MVILSLADLHGRFLSYCSIPFAINLILFHEFDGLEVVEFVEPPDPVAVDAEDF